MEIVIALIVGITMALVFGLGGWLFRRFSAMLDALLPSFWRWLSLPITAVFSAAGFLVLRPFVLDQPRTPLWRGTNRPAWLVGRAFADYG